MDTCFDPLTDPQFIKHGFKIGFAEDRNKRFRRTMEDAHSIITDFGSVSGSGLNFIPLIWPQVILPFLTDMLEGLLQIIVENHYTRFNLALFPF
jgi:hypothetical protein